MKDSEPGRLAREACEQSTGAVLGAEQIIEYLRGHPDFFQGRERLLAQLQFGDPKDKTLSLVDLQIRSLREQLAELRERVTENERFFRETKNLILALASLDEPAEIVARLREGMLENFDIQAFTILLFGSKTMPILSCIRRESLAVCKRRAPAFAQMKDFFCNVLRPMEARFLFQSEEIKSAAVARFQVAGEQGLFCLGSFSQTHFHSGMGDVFVQYIAGVTERLLTAALRRQAEAVDQHA